MPNNNFKSSVGCGNLKIYHILHFQNSVLQFCSFIKNQHPSQPCLGLFGVSESSQLSDTLRVTLRFTLPKIRSLIREGELQAWRHCEKIFDFRGNPVGCGNLKIYRILHSFLFASFFFLVKKKEVRRRINHRQNLGFLLLLIADNHQCCCFLQN